MISVVYFVLVKQLFTWPAFISITEKCCSIDLRYSFQSSWDTVCTALIVLFHPRLLWPSVVTATVDTINIYISTLAKVGQQSKIAHLSGSSSSHMRVYGKQRAIVIDCYCWGFGEEKKLQMGVAFLYKETVTHRCMHPYLPGVRVSHLSVCRCSLFMICVVRVLHKSQWTQAIVIQHSVYFP